MGESPACTSELAVSCGKVGRHSERADLHGLTFPKIGFVRRAIAAPRWIYTTSEWGWEGSEVLEGCKLASAEKSRCQKADHNGQSCASSVAPLASELIICAGFRYFQFRSCGQERRRRTRETRDPNCSHSLVTLGPILRPVPPSGTHVGT